MPDAGSPPARSTRIIVTTANPEIGQSLRTGDIITNYHDVSSPETADGTPLLLLHGPGPV